MVRVPPYWHPQAAKRGPSTLRWAPGWRGTGQQPIRPVAVQAYTGKISSVPLTGGQAQGVIPGIVTATQAGANTPTSGQLLALSVIPVSGTYTVNWTVTLAGTTGPADVNNFVLYKNNTLLATSVNAGATGTYVQSPVTVTAQAGDGIALTLPNTPTSGAVYGGTISGPSNPLTLQVGPQGVGTTWYPVSVTLSTSTGPLDTSTALLYLGSGATPTTLQGTVYSGNGTASLAIPSMSPGQTIIAVWTGGHAADTAAFNVVGTMDALSTGHR